MLPMTPRSTVAIPGRAQGFTLVEVMIVVAIVAILALMAGVSYQPWIANGQIRTTASSIADGLRSARAEALKRNKRVSFQLCGNNGALAANSGIDGAKWVVSLYPQTTSFTTPCTGTTLLDADAGKGAFFDGSTVSASDGTGSPSALTTTVIARQAAVLGKIPQVRDWTGNGRWSITFDGLGRVVAHPENAVPTDGYRFEVTTQAAVASGPTALPERFRPLTVLVSSAGQIRMCDTKVTDPTNPRACP